MDSDSGEDDLFDIIATYKIVLRRFIAKQPMATDLQKELTSSLAKVDSLCDSLQFIRDQEPQTVSNMKGIPETL